MLPFGSLNSTNAIPFSGSRWTPLSSTSPPPVRLFSNLYNTESSVAVVGMFFTKIVLHRGTVLTDMSFPSNVGFFLKPSFIL